MSPPEETPKTGLGYSIRGYEFRRNPTWDGYNYRLKPPSAAGAFVYLKAFRYNGPMSYLLRASQTNPIGLWGFTDGARMLSDYSGYGNNATSSSTVSTFPVVQGSARNAVFDSTNYPTAASKLTGLRNQQFVMSGVVKVIGDSQTLPFTGIISSATHQDGLYLIDDQICFGIRLADGEIITASARRPLGVPFFAAGVYVGSKLGLIVDGLVVAEATVPVENPSAITTGVSSVTFARTAGSHKTVLSGCMINPKPLTAKDLDDLNFLQIKNVSIPFKDMDKYEDTSISQDSSNEVSSYSWPANEAWSNGFFDGMVFVGGTMMSDQNSPNPGVWQDTYIVSSSPINAHSINVSWTGDALVEVSLNDGATWATQVNGGRIAAFTAGSSTENVIVSIRVTCDGDEYIANLTATTFVEAQFDEYLKKKYTAPASAVVRRSTYPYEYNDFLGTSFTGSSTLSLDDSESAGTATVEMWVKNSGGTFSVSPTPTNTFINGKPAAPSSIGDGLWSLVQFRYGSIQTGDITISSTGQLTVGRIVSGDLLQTDADLVAYYEDYVNAFSSSVTEETVVVVADSATQAKVYGHDWDIGASG